MDLNIQRVFTAAETEAATLLAPLEQPIKDGINKILSDLKSTATQVVSLVEPTLEGDVQTLETGAETLLNAFISSKVKGAAGTLTAAAADQMVDSAATTLVAYVQQWAAKNKSGQ